MPSPSKEVGASPTLEVKQAEQAIPQPTKKRKSISPGNQEHGDKDKGDPKQQELYYTAANGRQVKRRASKACQTCRLRKVRCNVVDHGVPCTNCRMDHTDCTVVESKRKRKKPGPDPTPANIVPIDTSIQHANGEGQPTRPGPLDGPHEPNLQHAFSISRDEALRTGSVNPQALQQPGFGAGNFSIPIHDALRRISSSSESLVEEVETHVPHSLYVNQVQRSAFNDPSLSVPLSTPQAPLPTPAPAYLPQLSADTDALLRSASMGGDRTATRLHSPGEQPVNCKLPAYVKPLPPRMGREEIEYLVRKNALSVPSIEFRNALLVGFVEYVYPYMPAIDLHEFLRIINKGSGVDGKVSLILLHAVMFTGIPFVDMRYLREAGFDTRRGARKAFYQKTRLLYDFDYELDRLVLIQSLLLMTYWYESPEDQKDTWHWMGVAISQAHTLGLHRDPERTVMDSRRKKLWKRTWWSCFMRDRLVALGMRRPTRIKEDDFDVPMLAESDFEIAVLPLDNTVISPECVLIRNLQMQTDMAHLCIYKARLSICISHVLSSQYSVLVRDHGAMDNHTRTTVMLVPKKIDQIGEVRQRGQELLDWKAAFPEKYKHKKPTAADVENGRATMVVQKALLEMMYWATVSALHRPQVLPAEPVSQQGIIETRGESYGHVCNASTMITQIAADLHARDLERFLPTTGVTVILPAIIIHLQHVRSREAHVRKTAVDGFIGCMRVLQRLRDSYAAADFAAHFLEAAIKKIDMDVAMDGADTAQGVGPGEGLGLMTLPPTRIADNVSSILESQRPPFSRSPDQGHLLATGEATENATDVSMIPTDEPDARVTDFVEYTNGDIVIPASIPSSRRHSSADVVTNDTRVRSSLHRQQDSATDGIIDWTSLENMSTIPSRLLSTAGTVDGNWNSAHLFESLDVHGETGGFEFDDIIDENNWSNGAGDLGGENWHNG